MMSLNISLFWTHQNPMALSKATWHVAELRQEKYLICS